MLTRARTAQLTAILVLAVAAAPTAVRAQQTFSVTNTDVNGQLVSAEATFSVVNATTLDVTLTNLTAGGTNTKDHVLTGVIWNWAVDPAAVGGIGTVTAKNLYDSIGDTINDRGVTDITNKIAMYGAPANRATWMALKDQVNYSGTDPDVSFDYGLGGAVFGGGGMSTNGDDYGVVALGTDLTKSTFGDLPFAMNQVVLRLTGFAGLSAAEDYIGELQFMWTSSGKLTPGEGDTGGSSVVPEASSLTLLAFGGLPLGLATLRARRRR